MGAHQRTPLLHPPDQGGAHRDLDEALMAPYPVPAPKQQPRTAGPSLSGTKDLFCGRQFFHGPGEGGYVLG